jgi:DNA-binding transcriptional regulator YiaG
VSTPKEKDLAEAKAHQAAKEAEQRKAVRRQVRAGLADSAVAKVLHMSRKRVTELREELGLPRNPGGRE